MAEDFPWSRINLNKENILTKWPEDSSIDLDTFTLVRATKILFFSSC